MLPAERGNGRALEARKPEPYPYISKTPEDVWRMIFVALHDDASLLSDRSPGRDDSCWVPVTLGLVCRLWRDITRRTPALFRYIAFQIGFFDLECAITYLRTYIELSGMLPLIVSVLVDPIEEYEALPYVRCITEELVPHMHRLRSLRIRVFPEQCCECSSIFHPQRNPLSLLPRELPLTGLPLGQLRILQLENVRFAALDHLLLFLKNAPKLENLTIRSPPDLSMPVLYGMKMPDEPHTRIVHMPSLRKLSIEVAVLRCLLSCGVLCAPRLKDVALDDAHCSTLPVHEFPNIRVMQRIQSLQVLGHIAFDGETMVVLIAFLPELRRLSVQHCAGIDDGFLKALCVANAPSECMTKIDAARQQEWYLAPQLDRLEIIGGSITNKYALRLLDTRSSRPDQTFTFPKSPPPSKTVMLHISGCWATTRKLGRELKKRKRGTWSEIPRTPNPHWMCHEFMP